jgi:hypothetical protein
VKVDIVYLVKQLFAIRRNGSTCFLVMIQTYINFATLDWVSLQLNVLYAIMKASDGTQTAAAGTSISMCRKCKEKSLHKVGRKSCLYRDFDDGSARSAGTLAAKLCREGSTKTEGKRRARWDAETDALTIEREEAFWLRDSHGN